MQVHTKFNGELSFQVWAAESLDEQGNPLPGALPKQETPFQPQIITDAFFETWLNDTAARLGLFSYCAMGNGTLAATASDTTISQVSTRFPVHTSGTLYTVGANTITQTIEYRSTQGQVIGVVSEVGLFGSSTGGQTMMRSLIKDAGGAATSLTLTSMDFIYVKWRVTATVNTSDVTGVINIGGVNYNYTLRPCHWNLDLTNNTTTSNPFAVVSNATGVNSYLGFSSASAYATQTLGSITSGPGGSQYPGWAFSTNSYTAGTKQRKMTYKWNIDQGNIGSGIGSITIGYNAGLRIGYQISFAATSDGATIPKDDTKEFTLGITFSYGR
ncbi:hypothetical protein EKK58_12875 [Candidatus Dependentiae bacterium]|nr:MAG: hypothetical protein EKK58_12875 [Candidatus Dependentiae bacterium]